MLDSQVLQAPLLDHRELDLDAARRVTYIIEQRFRYDYDARGNWVTKTVEGRGGADHDFTLSSVERRTIGYFE